MGIYGEKIKEVKKTSVFIMALVLVMSMGMMANAQKKPSAPGTDILVNGGVIANPTSADVAKIGLQSFPGIPTIPYKENRLLVKPKAGVNLKGLNALHSSLGSTVNKSFAGIGNLQVINLAAGKKVGDSIKAYKESPLVEYAEPDYILAAEVAPNDPKYVANQLWGLNDPVNLKDIDAPEGWDIRNNASSVIVAVIDSGIRVTHEDLAANIWVNSKEIPGNSIDDDLNGVVDDVNGFNAISPSSAPLDNYGHGTHVAGTIGAIGNNNLGVVGVAWQVKIMPCKFLDSTGTGTTADAISCIDYARKMGADIVNASWGGGSYSTALKDAIASLQKMGIIFIAAAGNDSVNTDITPNYPSTYELDNIVSVAATNQSGALATFSNYGINSVDIAAPGTGIWSSYNLSNSSYEQASGTSMATPHVTGVVALLKVQYPNDKYSQTLRRLYQGSVKLPGLSGFCMTGGLLNLKNALSAPLTPANDNAANAIAITDSLFTPGVKALGNNQFATKQSGEPNHGGNVGGSSVWWKWTAPGNGSVILSTEGTGFDTIMAVYSGSSFSPLIAQNDDQDGTFLTSQVQFSATSGTTYYIAVDGYEGEEGDIQLLARPGNDVFPGISVPDGSYTANSEFASWQPFEPEPTGIFDKTGDSHSLWWTWTPTSSGKYTVDTEGSNFDTVLGIYTGASINNLSLVAQNDDGGPSFTSKILFNAVAGTAYRILVTGYNSGFGDINLHIIPDQWITVQAVNPEHWPQIISTVSIDSPGALNGTLTKLNFSLKEDGVTIPVDTVEKPAGGNVVADIVVLFDDTGSMADEISGMKSKASDFAWQIYNKGVNARFALVSFKDAADIDLSFTDNIALFQSSVNALTADAGGDTPEVALDAIQKSLSSLTWRTTAQKVFLVITDAPTHYRGDGTAFSNWTMPEVVLAVQNAHGTVHVVGPALSGSSISSAMTDNSGKEVLVSQSMPSDTNCRVLADETGGVFVDIHSADFSTILNKIVGAITNVWLVMHTTPIFPNGLEHGVCITVTDPTKGTSTDCGKYKIDPIFPPDLCNPDPANGESDVAVDTKLDWDKCTPSGPTTPSSSHVVINEFDMGENDAIELYNPASSPIDLSNWKVESRRTGYLTTFTIPAFTLAANSYVVLRESAGTNSSAELFFNQNIWCDNADQGSCALINSLGIGVDFVRWKDSTGSIAPVDNPPSGTNWLGTDINAPLDQVLYSLGRNGIGTDTDNVSDWDNTGGVDVNGKTLGFSNQPGSLALASDLDKKSTNPVGLGINDAKPGDIAGTIAPKSNFAATANSTNFTTVDNDNNSFTGTPDNDMDIYLFNTDSITPIEFTINVTETSIVSARLLIRAWDIDETSGEKDGIYVNGIRVGTLTGADGEWSATSIILDPTLIAPGKNKIKITIDENNPGGHVWATEIDWGQLLINNIPNGSTAKIRTASLNQFSYLPGGVVTGKIEVDTTLSSQNLLVETNIIDTIGINIAGTSKPYTANGSADDFITVALTLPTPLPMGVYTYQILVYDQTTGLLEDRRDILFNINDPKLVIYHVYLGTTSPPAELIYSGVDTICTPPKKLDPDTTYFWQVYAENYLMVNKGPIWSFRTTKACPEPGQPSILFPVDSQKSVPVMADLTWKISAIGGAGISSLALTTGINDKSPIGHRPVPDDFGAASIPKESASITASAVSLPFSDDMEGGANGWTTTGFWHQINHPENITISSNINPRLVHLPDSEGRLPTAKSGSKCWWYGEDSTGTFIGTGFDLSQPDESGGKSTVPNTGSLLSPPINLTSVANAYMSFWTWYEIEGVDSDTFDMMYIEASIDNGSTFNSIGHGHINPANDVNGQYWRPYSSDGLGTIGKWVKVMCDLTPFVGSNVVVRFRFDTRDNLYNGFRGWFIDDVKVQSGSIPAPIIGKVTPRAGFIGSWFDIMGAGFVNGSNVKLGATYVSSLSVISSEKIQVQVPSLANGTYSVTVVNPNTLSATLAAGYSIGVVTAPSLTAITPNSGAMDQQVSVTLDGGFFQSGAVATIDGVTLTNIVFVSPTKITAKVPSGVSMPGFKNVRVINPDGQFDELIGGYEVLSKSNCSPTKFYIFMDENNPPTTLKASDITGLYTQVGPLKPSTLYYWKVVARNDAGIKSSPVWSFQTRSNRHDFNADGNPDIAWRHRTTGDAGTWYMNKTVIAGQGNLPKIADMNWELEATGDFNLDGKADMVWRNQVTGDSGLWYMDSTGVGIGSVEPFNKVAPEWRIAGVADFNGDSYLDIFWRNSKTGENGIWFMNKAVLASTSSIVTVPSMQWVVEDVGDFDLDGKADLFWRNLDPAGAGENGIWFMNGGMVKGITYLPNVAYNPGVDEWRVALIDDFNGDGNDDLLWRNYVTGQDAYWYLKGSSVIGTEIQSPNVDPVWKICSPHWFPAPPAKSVYGDFDGDGKADILWRNTTTGAMKYWKMDGESKSSEVTLTGLGLPWNASVSGDFDGDGKIDVLYRNSSTGQMRMYFANGTTGDAMTFLDPTWELGCSGDINKDGKADLIWYQPAGTVVYVWYMNSNNLAGWDVISEPKPAGYVLVGSGDFNNDGKIDLFWRNMSSGLNLIWYMNGKTKTSSASMTSLGTDWILGAIADFNADGNADIGWQNTSTGAVALWRQKNAAIDSTIVLPSVASPWRMVGPK